MIKGEFFLFQIKLNHQTDFGMSLFIFFLVLQKKKKTLRHSLTWSWSLWGAQHPPCRGGSLAASCPAGGSRREDTPRSWTAVWAPRSLSSRRSLPLLVAEACIPTHTHTNINNNSRKKTITITGTFFLPPLECQTAWVIGVCVRYVEICDCFPTSNDIG